MRSLADIIDALDRPETKPVTPMEQPGIAVPPLQQKIEVLKKLADIPSSRAVEAITQDEDEPWEG